MKRLAIFAVVATLSVSSNAMLAAEPESVQSFDDMKARWAEASANVTGLHADIRKFVYDHKLHTVTALEGTLDVENPVRYRLVLRPTKGNWQQSITFRDQQFQPSRGSASTVVWNGNELFLIDPERRLCDVLWISTSENSAREKPTAPVVESSSEDAEAAARKSTATVEQNRLESMRAVYKGEPFWEMLVAMAQPGATLFPTQEYRPGPFAKQIEKALQKFAKSIAEATSMDRALHFLVSNPKSVADQEFALMQRSDFMKGISAVPVTEAVKDRAGISRIDLLFDPDSGLPFASRAFSSDDEQVIVLVLKKVQLNAPPEAIDLYCPNLEQLESAGYSVIQSTRANKTAESTD